MGFNQNDPTSVEDIEAKRIEELLSNPKHLKIDDFQDNPEDCWAYVIEMSHHRFCTLENSGTLL